MADTKIELPADGTAATQNPNVPPQPNNPLSRKLNKILETRLDNDKVTQVYGSSLAKLTS